MTSLTHFYRVYPCYRHEHSLFVSFLLVQLHFFLFEVPLYDLCENIPGFSRECDRVGIVRVVHTLILAVNDPQLSGIFVRSTTKIPDDLSPLLT